MVSTKMVINGVKRNLVPMKEYKKPLLKLNSEQTKMFDRLETKKKSLLQEIESMESELREPYCLSKKETKSIKNAIQNKLAALSELMNHIRGTKKEIMQGENGVYQAIISKP